MGFLVDVVEDAVRAKDDLAQRPVHTARIGGSNKREGSQNTNVFEDTPSKPNDGLRVILGDKGADLLGVRNRRV